MNWASNLCSDIIPLTSLTKVGMVYSACRRNVLRRNCFAAHLSRLVFEACFKPWCWTVRRLWCGGLTPDPSTDHLTPTQKLCTVNPDTRWCIGQIFPTGRGGHGLVCWRNLDTAEVEGGLGLGRWEDIRKVGHGICHSSWCRRSRSISNILLHSTRFDRHCLDSRTWLYKEYCGRSATFRPLAELAALTYGWEMSEHERLTSIMLQIGTHDDPCSTIGVKPCGWWTGPCES